MSNVINELKQSAVFKYFSELSSIPRCSGNEKAVSDYLVNFAKANNLEVIQDNALNVIIKKNATEGHQNAPTVILQGHMDMVCEKNSGTVHNFGTESLKLRVDGDILKATDTTLGADNGIAVAYCMALLASDNIPHPPLEVLITTEEETGMGGASNVDGSLLNGKILINIDSEEEGELLVSCAGGVRSKLKLPLSFGNLKEDTSNYALKVRGLKGGHSGMDINKERGNSNKIIGRILNDLNNEIKFQLAKLNGGSKMNAIPREADAIIVVSNEDKEKLIGKINCWNGILKNELKSSDPEIRIELEENSSDIKEVLTDDCKKKVINGLMLIPNGIQTMSMDIEGLVQSSTNIGVITFNREDINFESAVRSSIKSLKYDIIDKISSLAHLLGGTSLTEADYPEWEYKRDSYIREVFINTYKEMTGNEPKVTAIHAGLECGLLKEKLGDIDIISFGPNMYDVHTPDESLSISSTKRTWEYLKKVLQNIK